MSLMMLEHTKEDIQEAYKNKSLPKIGKETLYVFDRVVHFMLSVYKDRLKGITFEKNEIDFDESFLQSQNNKDYMLKVFQYIHDISLPESDFEFGKMKLNVEQWYYRIGGKGMYFAYNEAYLITPKDAAEQLGVSNVTIHKYMKQGLETVDTTSHNKIPKHAIDLWKDPEYAIRLQMLNQENKIRNQSLEDRLHEVRADIIELQKNYKEKTVSEAMNQQGIHNMDDMDDPSDFRNWKDLEMEEEDILKELIGGTGFV